MGREVRRVSKNWEHPKNDNGSLKPLLGYSFTEQLKDWNEGNEQWGKGFGESWDKENPWQAKEKDELEMAYEEWSGSKPEIEDYMPEWKEEEKTHIQMYEDTSEGTPISPVFDNAEDLAHWLADNRASSFGSSTATYEQWLSTINRGFAPSMIMDNNGLQSGVEALS
jgi:hypothetical protein